jgi:organic hydroperoxide reductase OsmC/OhrA
MGIDAGKRHSYRTSLRWTGAGARGTSGYAAYSRDHEITGEGKTEPIPGSSDPHFRGNPARYNPEELLVASLSACHMLWYLHLCAVNHVVVVDYEDHAAGTMIEADDGSGEFSGVTLRPSVTIAAGSDRDRALELHHDAARLCFIARSVRFPVNHEPRILIE